MKKRIFIVLVVCLAFILTTWADKPPKDELWKLRLMGKNRNSIVVMTRNMYFGTDVDYVMDAQGELDLLERIAQAVQWFYSTNISERVEAFVDEIARGKPHLVGLQEVAIITLIYPNPEPPYDLIVEEFDFLALLEEALADRNLNYDVVGSIEDVNITMPMPVSFEPLILGSVQLIDYDVVLARNDVKILDVVEQSYTQFIDFLGNPILRGYVAVKAKVGRKMYWVASTHLEPDDPNVKQDQAMELITFLQTKNLPVIVLGDLNTPAPLDLTYQTFLANGYVDAWTRNRVRPKTTGNTNCSDPDPDLGPILRDPARILDQRIDLILVKSQLGICGYHYIGPVWAYVVGDEVDDMIENPDDGTMMWPSDHAGVIALLRIPYVHKFH
jgi:hypothetical protein